MKRPPVLDNPRSDRIRAVAALGGRSARRRTSRILIEGPQAVREAVRFRPHDIIDVYVTSEVEARDPALVAEAQGVTAWVHTVTDEVARAISPDGQGIVAVGDAAAIGEGNRDVWRELTKVSAGARSPVPFVVCLPETQDPGNAGTIIRTADAMGAVAVILGKGSVDPANPKVIRSSAGSVFHLPILRASLDQVRAHLPLSTWTILGTSGYGADLSLDTLLFSSREVSALAVPHAWVFGNEARGLSEEESALCDALVRIPLAGHAESLNAGAAAAMCLFASSLVSSTFIETLT